MNVLQLSQQIINQNALSLTAYNGYTVTVK